jgi:hypothetical protein
MNDESGVQMNARLKSYASKTASPKKGMLKVTKTSNVAASVETPPSGTKTRGFRTMTKEHVNAALTGYLRTMSLINADEEVVNFNKAPDSLDVKIERITNDKAA